VWLDWVWLAVGVVLTIGTGFFVASEFALVNLDRGDLESREAKGERHLGRTIAALKITSTHLSSAQLGITLTTLLTGYTMEPAISRLLEGPLESMGLPEEIFRPIGSIVGILIATLFSMIIGELVPKNLALAVPLVTAKFVIPFQTLFTTVFRPAVALLNGTANAILRFLGVEPKEELSGARSAEELSSLVRRSALAGVLDSDTATLLTRTLGFSELSAADVMTPRPRLAALERGDSAADVIELARRTGYSRFPVTDGGLDDIVGLVHIKQAMSVPREKRAGVPVGALQTDALRVPETMQVDTLLGELRESGYQMAVVVDEYGGTAGVATLEDLVEELVGDLVDEHDRTRAGVVRGETSTTFPGSLRPDEVLEQSGIEIPEDGDYETVAGYVLAQLGRLAKVGDEVSLPGGVLRVLRLDGRRIDRLRFTPSVATTDETGKTDRTSSGERSRS
jgi:CBS domain containing-hemolysin-like protein